jgi:hypothetical protein
VIATPSECDSLTGGPGAAVCVVKEEIGTISNQASQEHVLDEMMKKVISSWNEIDFELLNHKARARPALCRTPTAFSLTQGGRRTR